MNAEIEVFYSGENLLDFIENNHFFDLIFLDIELRSTTGIEISTKIRNQLNDHASKIVFITSRSGYEDRLFDVQPLNFIEKPINHEKIKSCLTLAIKLLDMEAKIFDYKKAHNVVRVNIKDISHFESKRKQIKIVTNSDEDFFMERML